uniref:BHLH domain-containing protein n=1 Tax=Panagrolaimus davidi TaxID=227884 RepID=A0A914NYI4_9BILA
MKNGTRKTIKKEVIEHDQRRRSANLRERQRTQELNAAFNDLRNKIPSMPADKLSKVHSLRIATAYITYLVEMLNGQNQSEFIDCNFKSSFHVWRSQKAQEQISTSNGYYKSYNSSYNFLDLPEKM